VCPVLFCFALFCATFPSSVLFCFDKPAQIYVVPVLFCLVLICSVLPCPALFCPALACPALPCFALLSSALSYPALSCFALYCRSCHLLFCIFSYFVVLTICKNFHYNSRIMCGKFALVNLTYAVVFFVFLNARKFLI